MAMSEGISEKMLPQEHKSVLRILAEHESMPFLELSSVTDMGDERLSQIVEDLEENGFVKITGRGSILDEIVTVRQRLAALTASAS
jgi:predicted transcriptional regulator